MKMMVVRLMAADIREVRITILLSDRHWPWLTLHLILKNIYGSSLITILDSIVVVVMLVRVLHRYV